jgi:hypothetical protein
MEIFGKLYCLCLFFFKDTIACNLSIYIFVVFSPTQNLFYHLFTNYIPKPCLLHARVKLQCLIFGFKQIILGFLNPLFSYFRSQ